MANTHIQNRTNNQLTVNGVDGEVYYVNPKAKTFIPCEIDPSSKKLVTNKQIKILRK